MRVVATVRIMLAVVLLLSSQLVSSQTQDGSGSWQEGFGPSYFVLDALTIFEGDLVVAGSFTKAGGVESKHVARWNGTSWSAFTTDHDIEVSTLTTFGADLVAGGTFAIGPVQQVSHVARWTGSAWEALGSGPSAEPQAFAEYQGVLVAGGGFSEQGYVAHWDGAAWSALGGGLAFPARVLTVHDGLLFAGVYADSGDCVFSWDGAAWAPVGTDLLGSVSSMTVWRGMLVVSGTFRNAAGEYIADFASWDGDSWNVWGKNLDDDALVLIEFAGDLIAGGWFEQADTTPVASVARWDGTSWHAMGMGVDGAVNALALYQDELVGAGDFSLVGDQVDVNLASWDGAAWRGIAGLSAGSGLGARTFALTFYNDDLVAGGAFYGAGGVRVNGIARWDGATWHAMAGGIEGDLRYTDVRALIVHEGKLVAGGNFEQAGGVPAQNIAAWDGSGWQAVGAGFNGTVYALESLDGDLIAAGAFTDAGGTLVPRIARWDGVSWSRMGLGFNNEVYALTIHDGSLVAAGLFTAAEAGLSNRLARWDGARWVDVGSGLGQRTICELGVYDGALFAGACPFWFGDWVDEGLWEWDGAQWQGLGVGWAVAAMAEFAGELYVVGSQVLAWNGSTLTPLGNGVITGGGGHPRERGAQAFAARGPDLFVGGNFTQAGAQESHYVAHWKLETTPVTVEQLQVRAFPNGVHLEWRLAQEDLRDIVSLSVQRAEHSSGPYASRTPAGLVPSRAMSFVDTAVEPDRTYWYRLLLQDRQGHATHSGSVFVQSIAGTDWVLRTPIETNQGVLVRFDAPTSRTPVRLEIFDVRGRLLRALNLGTRNPGEHTEPWNRRDVSGVHVPRGVYFVRLRAEDVDVARKFVLVRP